MESNKNILFSVVMPAYNCEKTVEESINSVINQTYENWELIIVNDCATDNTKEVIENIALKDNRIKVINKEENEGVGEARNSGVMEANGEWIALIDSDDLWTCDKLEKAVSQIEKYPNGKLFFTASAYINYDGEKSNFILHVPEKINFDELLKQNLISCSSVVAEKQLMLDHKMPSYFGHEDYETWLNILKEEEFAYGLDEPLLIYRLSKNSKSGNKLKAAKMNWITYRKVGLSFFKAIKYMCIYAYRSLKKYSSI